jgi:glycerol-1-phosphate dehydrogenase [NAD(P)+]
MIADQFTKSKTMVFPRQVLAGHGVLRRLPRVVEDLGYRKRCLIITGDRTFRIAGERINSMIARLGLRTRTEIAGDATLENLHAICTSARSFKPEVIIGVGGGSKIDLGKMAAKECGADFISVPTSASHDGIASPRVSIKKEGRPLSMEGVMPMAIVADTAVISKAPYRMLAAGCADVVSNSTALLDWELAVRKGGELFSTTAAALSRYACESIMASAQRIRGNDETSAWLAVRPIIASGLAMGAAGSSRPASGSEHLFSHALDAITRTGALHGEQCGVGAIMMMALHGGGWERIRDTLLALGCPVSAEGLGVPEKDIVSALVAARTVRKGRYTILDVKRLDRNSARKLARTTGVI